MTSDPIRSLTPRIIGGTEVLVSTEPDEVFLDIPAAGQDYIRVVEGEIVREGDVRTRDEQDLDSQTLRAWEINKITTETVRGTGMDSGESKEWDREKLEQKLADGTLSTDLTDFERADVPQREDDEPSSGSLTVTVTVYGNNGQRFKQTFRSVGTESASDRQLELSSSDPKVDAFDDALQEKFTRAVEIALRNEGFSV